MLTLSSDLSSECGIQALGTPLIVSQNLLALARDAKCGGGAVGNSGSHARGGGSRARLERQSINPLARFRRGT